MRNLASQSGIAAQTVSSRCVGVNTIRGAYDGELVLGDTLTLSYSPPDSSAQPSDWTLLIRRPMDSGGGLGSREVQSTPLPRDFALAQNHPNPFSRRTTIRFELPVRTRVKIEVIDLAGRRVKVLTEAEYTAGYHSVEWDKTNVSGGDVRPGVFVYRLTAGSFRKQKKMTLLP